tara:strand:- start:2867 stop:3097 length:231 start_codon:yes stop_codon:yes gene_type:complete
MTLKKMTSDQLKAFLLEVEKNEKLRELLRDESNDPISIAKDFGFIISTNDLVRASAWNQIGFPLNSSDFLKDNNIE